MSSAVQLTIKDSARFDYMRMMVGQLSPWLSRMEWEVFAAEDGASFITTDSPVSFYNPFFPPPAEAGTGGDDAATPFQRPTFVGPRTRCLAGTRHGHHAPRPRTGHPRPRRLTSVPPPFSLSQDFFSGPTPHSGRFSASVQRVPVPVPGPLWPVVASAAVAGPLRGTRSVSCEVPGLRRAGAAGA